MTILNINININTDTGKNYDVVVVGGGHAGVEAAHAASRMGAHTCLITMTIASIAQMNCNPAIGGLAKGQIVREIDAMGGIMAKAIDEAGIQFRMLNKSKGPAVWAPRSQADKDLYHQKILALLEQAGNLDIIEDEVAELQIEPGSNNTNRSSNSCKTVRGVVCKSGRQLKAGAVIITAGTFLRGLMHTGTRQFAGGCYGEKASVALSESLQQAGLELQRLKTGTPARLDADSINFNELTVQYGDEPPEPFSFMNDRVSIKKQCCCWITYTNEHTHKIIRDNLDRAPLYTGQIKSAGPRYCPSIETKIVRFADKARHQVFLEPQGLNTNWIYANGISTSLPEDVQLEMIHSIKGLENARVLRYGYAIEYDYVPPLQIYANLETKKIQRLFLAGQINGTSGYEEAAGQGLMAGVNAVLSLDNGNNGNNSNSSDISYKDSGNNSSSGISNGITNDRCFILSRNQAYIGVLIDDLVTRGVDEPYRMFTSRAEYRLLLRSDNADMRLTALAHKLGIICNARWQKCQQKQQQYNTLTQLFEATVWQGRPLSQWLARPGHDINWLITTVPEITSKIANIAGTTSNGSNHTGYNADVNIITNGITTNSALMQVLNDIRYAGYIRKQDRLIERFRKAENLTLPRNYDYSQIPQLRHEAQEKLNAVQPLNLGQASRISGINPADITIIMLRLQSHKL